MPSFQTVYLIGDDSNPDVKHPRYRIHKAQRSGTRGRDLIVNPRCQIYEPYFGLYRVLTDLDSIGPIVGVWSKCKHCFPDQQVAVMSDEIRDGALQGP